MYNDIFNYSISMVEFLYKNIDENRNLVPAVFFEDPGTVKHSGTVWMFESSYHYHKTDARTALFFAANEPNFCQSFNEHKKYAPNILDAYDRLILISDYNNTALPDYIKEFSETSNTVYFFFQGYLAKRWYYNYKHYKPRDTFNFKYNSSSRLISGYRDYRLYLTSQLPDPQNNQVSCSVVCPYSGDTIQDILSNPYCFLNDYQKQCVIGIQGLPYRYDHHDLTDIPNMSYEIDWKTQSQSFLHVVNETVFYETFNHLTEKIFKPIVLQRPFVLASTPFSLDYLKRYGFKTFDAWWDESYDSELDPHNRLDKIAAVVCYINTLSLEQLHSMYAEMLPVLEHNRNLFYGEFEDAILQELLVNYQQALNK